MSPTRRLAAVVVFVVMLMVTGCGGGKTMGPTITLAQATERVDRMIRDAFAQLPAGAQLQASGPNEPLPCERSGGVDTGQVFSERKYQIVHPDSWPADQLIETLHRYWASLNYPITRDDRDKKDIATLIVKNSHENVEVGVKVCYRSGGTLDAYLVGDSGCVWENGTPPSGS